MFCKRIWLVCIGVAALLGGGNLVVASSEGTANNDNHHHHHHATMTDAVVNGTRSSSSKSSSSILPPDVWQPYRVLSNKAVSPDSHILTVANPEGRPLLGFAKDTPTCLSVSFTPSNNDTSQSTTTTTKTIERSYSPISHPNNPHAFELLVKSYPNNANSVGTFLCRLQPNDVFWAKVKPPRLMHASSAVLGRWTHVGLIGGGTGIAPLYQIAKLLLEDDDDDEINNSQSCPYEEDNDNYNNNKNCSDNQRYQTVVHVLSIHRTERDILLRQEMNALARAYPHRFFVTYALTRQDHRPVTEYGRGSVEMLQKAFSFLPRPGNNNNDDDQNIMVLVCGKDGFVETWGGPIGRAPPLPDGRKGPKIQGPLLGLLRDAGLHESQVFKY